jgi:hypothetical protein
MRGVIARGQLVEDVLVGMFEAVSGLGEVGGRQVCEPRTKISPLASCVTFEEWFSARPFVQMADPRRDL